MNGAGKTVSNTGTTTPAARYHLSTSKTSMQSLTVIARTVRCVLVDSVLVQQPQEQRYPFLPVCAVFSCVQTMVWLLVFVIFNVRTYVDACDYTQGLYEQRESAQKVTMYLWWSLCTLYLHACQVRVTVGDSGFCCCCTCVTYFER